MSPPRTGRLLPAPKATTPASTLPYDLLLEIVSRPDVATVVRSAATCKTLRRSILSPGFIRRVCQHGPNGGAVVPRFLVGYLSVHNKTGGRKRVSASFSLAHPATPAATSFSEDHLAPFLSRRAAAGGLGRRYRPVTSRNGLVVLRRGQSDICVYDPMTGNREYLLCPDICRYGHCMYVLLTAADGIGCSFLLLATDLSVFHVQVASSDSLRWGPPFIYVQEPEHHSGYYCGYVTAQPHSSAVVLDGSIHWIMRIGSDRPPNIYILTYAVPRHGTRPATTTGSIEFPKACLPDRFEESDLHLTSSPNGKLSLLVADGFSISIWLLSGSGSTGNWARQSVIDTEAIVRSVSPHDELPQSDMPSSKVDFVSSAGLRSGAVLLRPFVSLNDKGEKGLVLLDVGTEGMHRVHKKGGFPYEVHKEGGFRCEVREKGGFPYEVDMEARLSAMKIFD